MAALRKILPDSLFTRMLVVQSGLVTAAALIFVVILAMDHSVMLARPYVALAVPALRLVAASPVGTPAVPAMGLSGGLRRESGPPPGISVSVFLRPVQAFKGEMALHGIQVDQARLTEFGVRCTVWMELHVDGGPPTWISFNGYRVVPTWGINPVLGLVLLCALVAVVSRYFVRRVTQPLARLHERMISHAHSGVALSPLSIDSRWPPPPELQAMDRAYTLLAERLARNERERSLLLAGVSHDLRSPLSRIRLAAEMLPETSENAGGVATITRNVDQADRLIASFLEFVRAGTQRLDETVDAAAIVRQAVESFRRPNRELTARAPERLVLRDASSLMLERLAMNLIENALKHGALPVEVHLACDGPDMHLDVVDAGPGLPPGGSDSLLEAFARGDTSRGVPGFGLGLAIVHQIVIRLQGRLSFEHMPTLGHRVRVSLPLRR